MASTTYTAPAPAAPRPPALLDLEPELTCSICTDLVYQPLTLLDCLHTFCGSCLREWFAWQAAAGRHVSSRAHPLTCPACRAAVRATRANATVTTLLDMHLAAHPSRAKSQQERDEIAKTYTPGDAVIPAEPIRGHGYSDTRGGRGGAAGATRAEELGLRELRVLTIQDMEATTPTTATLPTPARQATRTHVHDTQQSSAGAGSNGGGIVRSASLLHVLRRNARASEEMKADILRQISEEGLLDGINLDDISAAQEEQISERIAQAYRRKQREREREVRGLRRERDRDRDASREQERDGLPRPSGTGTPAALREPQPDITTSRSPRRSWTADAASRTPPQQTPPASSNTSGASQRPASARPVRSSTASSRDMLDVPEQQQQRRRSPQPQPQPQPQSQQPRDRRATDPMEPRRPSPSAQWHGPSNTNTNIATAPTTQRTQLPPTSTPQPQPSSQTRDQPRSSHHPPNIPTHFTWHDAPSSTPHFTASSSIETTSMSTSTSTPPSLSTSNIPSTNHAHSPPIKRILRISPTSPPLRRRARALWAWRPSPGAHDELAFPRGAVIDDVVDVNGDWWWGRYGGGEGVFPGGYCVFVEGEG